MLKRITRGRNHYENRIGSGRKMSQDYTCTICGDSLKKSMRGSTSHAAKHKRQFSEQTGLTKRMNYDIVKAYFNARDAPKWANEIVQKLEENDVFERTNLSDF